MASLKDFAMWSVVVVRGFEPRASRTRTMHPLDVIPTYNICIIAKLLFQNPATFQEAVAQQEGNGR
jgi:hypothetical protein